MIFHRYILPSVSSHRNNCALDSRRFKKKKANFNSLSGTPPSILYSSLHSLNMNFQKRRPPMSREIFPWHCWRITRGRVKAECVPTLTPPSPSVAWRTFFSAQFSRGKKLLWSHHGGGGWFSVCHPPFVGGNHRSKSRRPAARAAWLPAI